MRNLAGIETVSTNFIVAAELAKAGIPAFDIDLLKSPEVRATIIGALTFAGGQEVVLVRAWTYWVVHLKEPLPSERAQALNLNWRGSVRVDGYAGGKDPNSHGAYSYHVDSQEGLNALAMELKSAFGQRTHFWLQSGFVCMHMQNQGRVLNWHPSPASKEEIARLEIAGLLSIGPTDDIKLLNIEEALTIATSVFGKKSQESRNIRLALADHLRGHARRVRGWAETIHSARDRFGFTWDLERLLIKRAANLSQLGRNKEAQSVRRQRDEVRVVLVPMFLARIADYERSLREELSGPPKAYPMADYDRWQIAFKTGKLSQLLKSMKRNEEAEDHWEAALAMARQCSEEGQRNFEKRFGVAL